MDLSQHLPPDSPTTPTPATPTPATPTPAYSGSPTSPCQLSQPCQGKLPCGSSLDVMQGHRCGSLHRISPTVAATITGDGLLQVGSFTISLDAMQGHLGALSSMYARLRRVFPTQESLERTLRHGTIPIPEAALNFQEAFDAFKRVVQGERSHIDPQIMRRKIDSIPMGGGLSSQELRELRGLLLEGAQVATVCAGMDMALDWAISRPTLLQRGLHWLRANTGSVKVSDSHIQNRLGTMPFESFDPLSLRVDLDLMAQRIELKYDGSPVVFSACSAEQRAANLLTQGVLSRKVQASNGGLEGEWFVTPRSDQGEGLYATSTVSDVFSALQLGQTASRMISSLKARNIDVVRLCKFVDRSAAMGLKVCLETIPLQSHVRLSDIDDWAPVFEVGSQKTFSEVDRHDLAVLLVDAEVCLFVAGHLQSVLCGADNKAFWRSLWHPSIQDNDVLAARELSARVPSPLDCDCLGASGVAGNAAMLLGYTGEDRSGAGWRIPENPVVSLTWAMTRAG